MKVRIKNEIYFSKKNLKGFNKFFRIFIFLPMVALFEKKSDEGSLRFQNLKFIKNFLRNLRLYFKYLFKRKK